jgi:predicted  nucleic acid-binding Zn-ribbon protein
LETENKKKADQIKKLTDEINANTTKISKLKTDIETADLKIKATENNFNITYAHVANQITEKVEKIKTLN